jgi:hypothetical protein
VRWVGGEAAEGELDIDDYEGSPPAPEADEPPPAESVTDADIAALSADPSLTSPGPSPASGDGPSLTSPGPSPSPADGPSLTSPDPSPSSADGPSLTSPDPSLTSADPAVTEEKP